MPKDREFRTPQAVCFRCGECCTKYQVRLGLAEAQRIAVGLGLSLGVFLEKYADQRWPGTESLLLRQRDGACIFLEHTDGSKQTACLIHRVKPVTCRLWTPGVYCRECLDGLAKYWKLTINFSGQLEGSEDSLRDFHSFVESLMTT